MLKSLRNRIGLAALALVVAALPPQGARAAPPANEKPCVALSQKAPSIGADDAYQANALLISAARAGCLDLAKLAIALHANVEGRDRFGATALARAAEAGQDAIAEFLFVQGADVNARAVSGSTPLFLAAENGRGSTVRLLLSHKADANIPGRGGLRPLAAAAFNGDAAMADALLAAGADANALDETGKAAILYAAANGHSAAVRRLAQAGVDLNRKYDHGLTTLMWAAGYVDEAGVDDVREVLGFLLDKGVALNDRDDRGKSALAIARDLRHQEVVDMLLARGAVDDVGSSAPQSPAK
jgi:ankyrin repeat protein